MKVLVAGGTGFVGHALVHGLVADGHEVMILQHPNSKSQAPKIEGLKVAYINPESPLTEKGLMADTIINLVGIIRESPRRGVTFHKSHFLIAKNLADYAKISGIRRFLQMSAFGVGPNASTQYYRTKFEAENYLKESGLSYTIFRPAIIFGPGSHFIGMMAKMIKLLPFVPVVGDGNYKIQLVHINDVTAGFRTALTDDRTIGKIFEIAGPDNLTYDEVLDIIGKALGKKRVCKIHQPLPMITAMARLIGGFSWFPVTKDQINMLLESTPVGDNSYWEIFGLTPKTLEDSLKTDI